MQPDISKSFAGKEEQHDLPEPSPARKRKWTCPDADTAEQGGEDDLPEEVVEFEDSDQEEASVLEQCEQLSSRLREALQAHQEDRNSPSEDRPPALVSHEALVAACGEAAKTLKPYQVVGVNFLMLLKQQGITGSILADEMGLGKTAQAICFLGVLKHAAKDPGPHLIVAPASLLENWQRELQRWCPGLSVVTYYGSDRAALRQQLLYNRQHREADSDSGGSTHDTSAARTGDPQLHPPGHSDSAGQAGSRPLFNVMLTCYSLFERDSADQQADRSFMKKWKWSHLLLDEAHAVKNATAMRTKRLTRVAQHCRRRIMLTGTPLQNDLEELQNLLQFLLPDVFSREDINQAADLQEEEAVKGLTNRMKAMLSPFVLRRLKSQVASQLTTKQQHEELVSMTPEQAALYQKAVQQLRADAAGVAAKGLGRKAGSAGQAVVKQLGKQRVNNLFTHLRKIAQHPLLVRNLYTEAQVERLVTIAHRRQLFGDQCNQGRISEELLMYSDHRLHDFALRHGLQDYLLDDEAIMSSAKCQLMVDLLRDLQSKGSRPLIFSQWTSVLDILGWLLKTMGLPHVRLDGSTVVAERLSTVDRFNNPANGVFAFLLSTRAGGQGLNLTGADTVILHDVDFNPQIDRQAEDRCHRLGQTKPVQVYRLVTKDTVDEGIHQLAQRKLKLDAAVLDGITGQSDGKARVCNTEAAQMGQLLQSLIAGTVNKQTMQENEPMNGTIVVH
ncbi:hypothetical protein ABBQ32_008788 [Trebouxia sp. C0010 RCD-2024]